MMTGAYQIWWAPDDDDDDDDDAHYYSYFLFERGDVSTIFGFAKGAGR